MPLVSVILGFAEVSPHVFEPLRWRDHWFTKRGRCKHCYEAQTNHPISSFVQARREGHKGAKPEGEK